MAKMNNTAVEISTLKSLLELTKPRILMAVLMTGFTGMCMSLGAIPPLIDVLWCFSALLLSVSGSAIQNNLLDHRIDQKMARTRDRELAIEKHGQAKLWLFSSLLIATSIAISLLFITKMVALLIGIAVLTYVLWYTLFLKRYDPFGAILGGLPGAIPALIGGYAIQAQFIPSVWLLFTLMMLWQPPHFWALTLKIKDDYAAATIPVLPLVYGETYTKIFIFLYALALIPVSIAISIAGGYGVIYLTFVTFVGFYYLFVTYWYIRVKVDYHRAFMLSLVYIFLIFLSTIAAVAI